MNKNRKHEINKKKMKQTKKKEPKQIKKQIKNNSNQNKWGKSMKLSFFQSVLSLKTL